MAKQEFRLENVKDLRLGEEMRRRNSQHQTSGISVLATKGSSRGRSYSKSGKGNKSKHKSASRAKYIWYVGTVILKDISKRIARLLGRIKREKEYKSLNNCSGSDDEVLICNVDCELQSWLLDLGASFHSTSHKEILTNFQASTNLKKVYLANGSFG